MTNLIRNRSIAAVLLGMLASGFVTEQTAVAQISTFENYPEGVIGTSFVDPASGILFSDPIYNFPGGVFTIEHTDLSLPPDLPGNLLTGNGYSPGPALGLTAGFGFTFTLATPSADFQMDEVYGSESSPFSIQVVGYASNGQQVFQTSVLLPDTSPGVDFLHSVFESPTPVSKVVVTTPSSSVVGFDNIGVPIPEPSEALLALVAGASAWGYCRKKRANASVNV